MASGVDTDGVQLNFLGHPADAVARELMAGRPNRFRFKRGATAVALRTLVFGLIAVGVGFSAFSLAPGLDPGTRLYLAVLSILPFSVWRFGALVLAARRFARLKRSAGQSRQDGWNQVVISPKGVVWAGETHQEYVSWQGVVHVHMHPEIGIWFDCGKADGLLIPMRVFSDRQDYADVCRVIDLARQARTAPAHLVPRETPEQAEMPIVLH